MTKPKSNGKACTVCVGKRLRAVATPAAVYAVISKGGRAVAVRFDQCVAKLHAANAPARLKPLVPIYMDATQKVRGVFL